MSRLVSAFAPVLAIGALALLGACATVSPEQRAATCAQTDWHRFGVNDGKLGVPASERAELFVDCTRLGHPAEIIAYEDGRAEGLAEYCTVETGYETGREARGYQDVCPPELEPDFLQGLAQGREDRPNYALYPGLGIGIGSGGVRTGIGIGIGSGIGGWGRNRYYGSPFHSRCHYRDPFPCSWHRHGGMWGPHWW